jgi:hypothetical protein
MHLSGLDYLAAAGASAAAGVVNAIAGGGTLISFPALIGIGLPAVTANVTNTVGLLPGYLGGTWAQRDDLRPQLAGARLLAGVAALGGLAGSILLVVTKESVFRAAVPYLIVVSCALLLAQDRVRQLIRTAGAAIPAAGGAEPAAAPPAGHHRWGALATAGVFVAAVYGGFFGAGLGIVLLAVIGVFSAESLAKVNALKQALSFVINLVAAVFFAASGRVRWEIVPVMAVAAVAGGIAGGRLAGVIPGPLLRRLVAVAGVGIAIAFWVG